MGQRPISWGVFENFCVKSNLTVYKVTLNVSYRKKWRGEQNVLLAPPIILLGSSYSFCPPAVPAPIVENEY